MPGSLLELSSCSAPSVRPPPPCCAITQKNTCVQARVLYQPHPLFRQNRSMSSRTNLLFLIFTCILTLVFAALFFLFILGSGLSVSRDIARAFADTPNVVTSPGAAKHRGVAERVLEDAQERQRKARAVQQPRSRGPWS